MNVKAYIVVDSMDESVIADVQKQMASFGVEFQYSPYREQNSLNHCVEFYGTAHCQKEKFYQLAQQLNAFWSEEQDSYEDYGFNTKMFHPHIYYLLLELL